MNPMKQNEVKPYGRLSVTPPENLAVNNKKGRSPSNRKYVQLNDEGDLNPKGRSSSDVLYRKTQGLSLIVATWNVRTLQQIGKLDNLCQEADSLKADIIGVSETRWKDQGCIKKNNYTFIHSGGSESQHGVGFLVKNTIAKSVLGFLPVNDRCLLLKLKAKPFDISIIQVYAPTSDHPEEELEEFYESVNSTIKEVKSTDVLIVMGDFNAKVGNQKYGKIIGNFGLDDRNERGTRLPHFCEEHSLSIANTYFQFSKRQ